MHFNPRVATSDGVAVRASPAVHYQHEASAQGFGAGGGGNSHGYNYGDRIGTLIIPRLNRRVNVIAGATMSAMDFGAGWFSFTGLNSGNTALIAHNRGSAGFFSFVRLLQEGDIITLEAGGIIRSYAVAMVYYIEETDFSPLMQFGDNRLTLVTCREYHRSQRRVAVAFAVE
jgi:LPXTG-site transpeptidase (sortase) family protein